MWYPQGQDSAVLDGGDDPGSSSENLNNIIIPQISSPSQIEIPTSSENEEDTKLLVLWGARRQKIIELCNSVHEYFNDTLEHTRHIGTLSAVLTKSE